MKKKLLCLLLVLAMVLPMVPVLAISVSAEEPVETPSASSAASRELPDGYTELEYVKWTGSSEAYINTGIIPTNHSVEMKVYEQEYCNDAHWFGTCSRVSTSFLYHFTPYVSHYFWGTESGDKGAGSWSNDTAHIVQYNVDSDDKVILDGTVLGSGTNICDKANPILIGKRDKYIATTMQVYYFKVTNKNTGNLVCDYVPARRNSDGKVGFYNFVDGTFHYSATATNLIAGPSIDEEKYTLLEYVKWTDSSEAYIDTGIIPTNHSVEMKVYEPQYCNDAHWVGTFKENGFHFTPYSNHYHWGIENSHKSTNDVVWSNSTAHVLQYNIGENHEVILDGNVLGSGYNIISDKSVLIGRRQVYVATTMQVYYFKLTDRTTGNLLRDLIPAKKSDGTVGFIDKVSGLFYKSATATNLIAGPETSNAWKNVFDGTEKSINIEAEYVNIRFSSDGTDGNYTLTECPTYALPGTYDIWYQYQTEIDGEWTTKHEVLIITSSCTTPVLVPSANTGLAYTGEELVGVEESPYYAITCGGKATEPGTYTATLSLKYPSVTFWPDGTTTDKTVTWSIAKADYDMSGVTLTNGAVAYDGENHSLTVGGTLPAGVTVSYLYNGKSATSVITPGTYKVTARFEGDTVHYNDILDKTATFSIYNDSANQTKTGKGSVTVAPCSGTTINGVLVYGDTTLNADGTALGTTPKINIYSEATYGYTKIEYVQWTGSNKAFINTGVIPSNHTAEMKVYEPQYCNDAQWFGTDADTFAFFFDVFLNKYNWGYYHTGYSSGGTWSNETAHILQYNVGDDHKVILDGELLSSGTNDIKSDNVLYIGKRLTYNPTTMQVYYFKLTDKSTGKLVRDMIPVVRNSDGVAGLYDLVEGKFYSSETSYDLIAGPNVNHDVTSSTTLNGFAVDNVEYRDTLDIVSGVVTRNVGIIEHYAQATDASKLDGVVWQAAELDGDMPAEGTSVIYALATPDVNSVTPVSIDSISEYLDVKYENGYNQNITVSYTGHTLVYRPATNATITAAGNKAYFECTECGKLYWDPDCFDLICDNSYILPIATSFEVVYKTNEGVIVNSLTKDNTVYLLLSSDADFGSLPIYTTADATLTGTKGNPIALTAGVDTQVNLTKVFGTMKSGVFYVGTLTVDSVDKTFVILRQSDAAAMYITLDDGATVSYLNSNKENVATGSIVFADGEETLTIGLKKIKGRGNYSWKFSNKKGYNITLESKAEIIDGAGKQKKYCLVAIGTRGMDFMTQMSAYTLYQEICQNGDAVSYRIVDLYINGENIGMYMLTEKVQIDSKVVDVTKPVMDEGTTVRTVNANTANINPQEAALLATGITEFKYSPASKVTSQGGFIIEAGYSYSSEISGFVTSHGNAWTLKDPEAVTLSQITKIATYVQKLEDALFSDTGFNAEGQYYADLLDLDSTARVYLLRSFMAEGDFFLTSEYFYIDGDETGLKGKLTAGPAWDFDYYFLNSSDLMCALKTASNSGYDCNKWAYQLLRRADFTEMLYELNEHEFAAMVDDFVDPDNTTSTTVFDMYNDYYSLRTLDDVVWNHNIVSMSLTTKNQIVSRATVWDTIWSDTTNALRGVTVTQVNDSLVATANGATSYQWYTLNADNVTGTAIDGETTDTLANVTLGTTYYVVAQGTALAGTGIDSMTSNSVTIVNTRTVSFDMGGHGTQVAAQEISLNGNVTKPADPKDSKYLFCGWYKEDTFDTAWDFTTDTVSADTVIYAKWIQVTGKAVIGETQYETLAEAIAAAKSGDTITLYDNVTDNYVVIETGITLDLNAHNVTSKLFYSTGKIVDSGTTKGIVKADNYVIERSTGSYSPVKNGDGYSFYYLGISKTEPTYDSTNDVLTFGYSNNKSAAYLADRNTLFSLLQEGGYESTYVKYIVTVSWEDEGMTVEQNFVYNEGLIDTYTDGTLDNPALTLTISGLKTFNKAISIKGSLVTYTAKGTVLTSISTSAYTLDAQGTQA